MKRHFAAIIALFILTSLAFGQPSSQPVTATSAKLDELRQTGFEALYNLDYTLARAKFSEIVKLIPDHPAGPQFLAATLMTQTLNDSRRLQSSLYNSESFYNGEEDKPDPKVVEEFRALTRQARLLAEVRLKKDKNDIEALYFLGAIAGLKAAFATAVQRSFMGALRDGSNSVGHHRDVLKLDPNFHDAELTIGLYDYVVGSLPLPVKLLASIAGVRGSKKKGLGTLERVAGKGKFARDDARTLLIVLFKREKRFADALAVSRDLASRYSRNYIFKLESADALVALAAIDREAGRMIEADAQQREALAVYDSLLRDKSTRESAAKALDLIHFRYGESLLTAGQTENAAKEFLAAANTPGANPNLSTFAILRAGQALDLAGKRDQALTQYRAVLTRPNVFDSHDEAKHGLKEPYKPKAE